MDIITIEGGRATIQIERNELIIVANAINEAQEAIEAWEFSSRMGAEPSEAEQLRVKLNELLASMKERNEEL